MISARYAKIRVKAKLSSDHTPHSFKHTRVIHLKQDGAQAEAMKRLNIKSKATLQKFRDKHAGEVF